MKEIVSPTWRLGESWVSLLICGSQCQKVILSLKMGNGITGWKQSVSLDYTFSGSLRTIRWSQTDLFGSHRCCKDDIKLCVKVA